MRKAGRYERILKRINQLADELSNTVCRKTRSSLCEYAANDIRRDLFVINSKEGDDYIDCRSGRYVGEVRDRNGSIVTHKIEHGNLTTGEVVVINTEKLSDVGGFEREIHQLEGPLTFTPDTGGES
jgi:hypothetical protein